MTSPHKKKTYRLHLGLYKIKLRYGDFKMEKIVGPYAHTRTGVLGDKRSSMLESELQLTVAYARLSFLR